MITNDIETFSKLLQMSLLPVVLISAASLLLLSITNRLGRTVDRSRHVAREIAGEAEIKMKAQLRVLLQRSELLRASILGIGLSIFFSAMMIISLFTLLFFSLGSETWVLALFLASVTALILSVIFFMCDVLAALKAVRLDIATRLEKRPANDRTAPTH